MPRYPKPGASYTIGVRPGGKMPRWTLPRWLGVSIALLIAAVLFDGPTHSQQQISGGGQFTITGSLPAGSNTIGAISNTGFAVTGSLPAGTNAIGSITNTGFNVTGSLPTGTNNLGKTTDNTTCGTTVLDPAWAAVPTSSTAVTATTTCVEALIFSNTNSSAQTVTVTDGQATPITVVSAFSIPPNSQVTFPFYGTPMTSGIKWSAGGSGVTGTVKGYQ
jgi:hypothetical protein